MTEDDDVMFDEGGEASCYAHLLCLECGVVLDGSAHRLGCSVAVVNTLSSDAVNADNRT